MKLLPKRALIATVLATAFVGVSAMAIDRGMVQARASAQTDRYAQTETTQATPAKPHAEKRAQRHAQRMDRMQKKAAERQAAFKAELQLTPEQEPAWHAFVARTQPQARPAPRGSREDWSKLTTPERLDKLQALKAERDARLLQRTDAIKSFYAALNAEQQKVFDEKHARGFQHGNMHHKHGKGHRGMHRPSAPVGQG